jgi:hypothetical protein
VYKTLIYVQYCWWLSAGCNPDMTAYRGARLNPPPSRAAHSMSVTESELDSFIFIDDSS